MLKLSIAVTVMVMVMVCAPAAVWAEGGVAETEGVSVPKSAVSRTEKVPDGMVSLDFRDADIKDILRVLAYKSGLNIVAGPEVTGLVSIQLNDVPWQRALDVVLQTYGYVYERRENIINVTTVENLKKRREDAVLLSDQEPLVTKAFPLSYAKAANVIVSIDRMKTDRGTVNFDERTNAIIVRDTLSQVEMVGEIIKRLDTTTPQVLIEARIIETTLGKGESLGIDWKITGGASGAAWPTTWPLGKDSSDKRFFPDISDATVPFTYGTLDLNALSATLDMLESRRNTNTLSNPRIVTLDNQPARIVVGDQYPFPNYEYNKETASMQVTGWTYKDIGVVFEVTPRVNNANMVTLDLEPKITAIAGFVVVDQTANARVPQLTTREAKTSVMIKNGETLVIGGLISDVKTEIDSKVPILGHIPFLGRLFSHKSTADSKTDLLIFLTPHIITPVVEPAG